MQKPSKESMAVIMYTSGSTGKPKGVLIKHKQLLGMVAGLKVRCASSKGVYLQSECRSLGLHWREGVRGSAELRDAHVEASSC